MVPNSRCDLRVQKDIRAASLGVRVYIVLRSMFESIVSNTRYELLQDHHLFDQRNVNTECRINFGQRMVTTKHIMNCDEQAMTRGYQSLAKVEATSGG